MHILDLAFARPLIAIVGIAIAPMPAAAQFAHLPPRSAVSQAAGSDILEAFSAKVTEKNCTAMCERDVLLISSGENGDCQAVYVSREFTHNGTSLAATPAYLKAYPQFNSPFSYYVFSALVVVPKTKLVDVCLRQEITTSRGRYRLEWGSELDEVESPKRTNPARARTVYEANRSRPQNFNLGRLLFGRGIGSVVKVTVISEKPGAAITRDTDQFAFTNKTFRIDSSLVAKLKVGIGKNAKLITAACKVDDLVSEIIYHC